MAAELPELDAFHFDLPPERIAQHPRPVRDQARLLLLERTGDVCGHGRVRDLPAWLRPGDLLVFNATQVLPARLRGRKLTGGAAEALLLGPAGDPASGRFEALLRTSGKLRIGLKFHFGLPGNELDSEIVELGDRGRAVLAFGPGIWPYEAGEMPLPPYIGRRVPEPSDRERYQTVFARVPGAVAAPTAGLHFTPRLFDALEQADIERAELVLHVGPGTFRPIDVDGLRSGRLHAEAFELPEACADAIAGARARRGRVIAVGTTTARVLEARAEKSGSVRAGAGETDLFLRPGHGFRVVDGLLTNFHLPRSSLLMLVAAFAGRERILATYRTAIARGYRFYSYGDAMLIL